MDQQPSPNPEPLPKTVPLRMAAAIKSSMPPEDSTPPPATPPAAVLPPSTPSVARSKLPRFFLVLIGLLLAALLFFIKENGYWNQLLSLNPKSNPQTEAARVWVHYGTLQHHIGEFPEALAAYQQATTLDPQLYDAWWNLALIYDALHQPQEQLAALQQAVRTRPESPEAWASLTKIYLQLNQDHDAMMSRQQEEIAKNENLKEEDRERVALDNPSNLEAWIQWGMSRAVYRFVQPNCFDPKTLEIFQKASDHHSRNPWIWAHLGLSSIKKRNEIPGSPFLTEVQIAHLTSFQKSAELLPHDPTLFFMLGRAALWKGEFNIAINALQISTQSPKAHWLSWYYLGETYIATHRPDDAIAAYSKAQSLSPDSLEIQFGVAQAYLEKGKIDEAQQILEKENTTQHPLIPLTRRALVQIKLHEALLTQVHALEKTASEQKTESPTQPFRAQTITRAEAISIPPLDPLPQEISEIKPEVTPPETSTPLPQHRVPILPLVAENIPAITVESPKNPESSSFRETIHSSTRHNSDLQLRTPSLPESNELLTAAPHSVVTEDPLPTWIAQLQDQTLDEKSLQTILSGCEKKERFDLALLAAQQLIQRSPSALNWSTLGYLYGLQNKTSQEIDAYQKALLKEPNHRTALFNLGLAYLQQGRIPKAQKSFEKIVQNNLNDAEAWFHLGLAFEKQSLWNEACNAYQKTTELRPNSGSAWLNWGGVYASIKRPDLEIETYKKCLELNPHYKPAWNNLSIVLKSIGKSEDYEATQKRIAQENQELEK